VKSTHPHRFDRSDASAAPRPCHDARHTAPGEVDLVMTAADGVPCALLVGTTYEFHLCRQLSFTVLVEKTRSGRASAWRTRAHVGGWC
jgi:hypothetical protein